MKLKRLASPASKKSFAGHLWAGAKWSGRWWNRTKELTTKEQLLVCRCCSKLVKLKGPNCLWVLPEWRQLYKTISAFRMSAWEINVQIPLTNYTGHLGSSSLASHCISQASLRETASVPGVLHPEKGGNVNLLVYQGNQQMSVTSPNSSNPKESWQYLQGKEENIWN